MRSSALLTVASAFLATSVSALAVTKGSPLQQEKRQGFCLNYYEAQVIANDFASLISNYNATFANIVGRSVLTSLKLRLKAGSVVFA